MKYAVTGGLGFIGSNICRLLLKKGHQVIIIDNCHSGNETKISDIIDKVELHKNDIRDKNFKTSNRTNLGSIGFRRY